MNGDLYALLMNMCVKMEVYAWTAFGLHEDGRKDCFLYQTFLLFFDWLVEMRDPFCCAYGEGLCVFGWLPWDTKIRYEDVMCDIIV